MSDDDQSRPVRANLTGTTPQDLAAFDVVKRAGTLDMSQQLAESLQTTPLALTTLNVDIDELAKILADRDVARAEAERFREHSVALNTVGWNLCRAAELIPDGVTEWNGPDILDQLPYLAALVRAGRGMHSRVWAEIVAERHSAHRKHGATSMESCDRFADRRLRVLLEEVGEVATVLNDREHDHAYPNRPQQWHDDVEDNAVVDLRHELLQVAAMAVAWIAALDDEALA